MAINIYLTEPQERFVFSEAPHPAMCAGYGAGKSQAGVVRILLKALQYPGMDFAFVEPTFDLVRLIAWPRFEDILNSWGIKYQLNKSEAVLLLENKSKIIFRSADNPSRLVGFEVADAVIDEADILSHADAKDVWVKMIGRARQKKPDGKPNSVGAVSTPEGFKWLYETFEKNKKPGYELIRAPTYSNPYLPDGYLDSLKASYPENLLMAYCEGMFVNLTSGSVYHEFDRELNGTFETIQFNEPLHIGMDFNVNNMSAVVCVIRNGHPMALDEIVQIRDTPTMIEAIRSRYAGHSITIYPDASGKASKSVNASLSDISLLRSSGFTVLANQRNPAVKDRVMAVNQIIHNQGVRHFKVNPDRCPTLVEGLEQQAYNKAGEPDKSGNQDHLNDALGYFISYKFGIARGPVSFAKIVGV